jgi:hypothetical protein
VKCVVCSGSGLTPSCVVNVAIRSCEGNLNEACDADDDGNQTEGEYAAQRNLLTPSKLYGTKNEKRKDKDCVQLGTVFARKSDLFVRSMSVDQFKVQLMIRASYEFHTENCWFSTDL